MAETEKAAPGEQPQKNDVPNSVNAIIPQQVEQRLTITDSGMKMIPDELKQLKQWVLWRLERRDGNLTKVPYMPNRRKASPTNPKTWTSFHAVWGTYSNQSDDDLYFSGIGYVFAESDSYTGIDIDKCIAAGKISDDAKAVIKSLNSYTERSQSKTGVHTIVKAVLPPEGNRTGNIEMYDRGRFFCFTGDHIGGTPETIEERQQELNAIHLQVFNKPKPAKKSSGSLGADSVMTDEELIDKAVNASNGHKFSTLYSGDHSDYRSQSEAELALCNMLAFYTKNADQIDRIVRSSGLMRKKWEREDYRDETIGKALADVTEQYQKRSPKVMQHNNPASNASVGVQQNIQKESRPSFNLTDYGNAERLVYRHGSDLRYCREFGKWYIWNGRYFEDDRTGEIERRAKQTIRSIYAEAAEESDDDRRRALAKHARQSESMSKIKAMVSLSETEPDIPVTSEQLDADQWKLNCLNGVIDLTTGELTPHNRDYLITKCIPVDYDPDADCPTWKSFVNRIMQDEHGNVRTELVTFLQKAVGSALTGDINDQVMFVLYGSGKNGKSTFINTIKDMLGDYAKQASTETFIMKQQSGGVNNDIARLKGSRLVSAVESEQGKKLAESLIKQLTGGEPITARFLHREFFEFTPTFKIFFTTNHKPEIRGTDKGIWRRIRLIPFTVTIPPEERDGKLDEKLKREFPGILKWAVDGCLLWQREGIGEPKEVMAATEEYREEMDVLLQFVNDCCVINPKAKVASAKLYEAYTNWCDEFGEYPLKERKLREQLKESYGIEKTRLSDKKGTRAWEGIGLLEDNHYLPDVSDSKTVIVSDINSYRETPKNTVRSVRSLAEQEIAAAYPPKAVGMEEGEL